MKQRISSLCCSIASAFFIFITLFGLQQLSLVTAAAQAPQTTGPRIWLGESQPAAFQQIGAFKPGGVPSPDSLASADLDRDGVADLVVGYSTGNSGLLSIQRGNLDAFAPQSTASLLAIGRGQFPSPFQAPEQSFVVPVHPDFVVTGDFNGDGHPDVAVAAMGGSGFYIFLGDGKGGLSAPQVVNLPGSVTTLAAGNLGRAHLSSLLAGTSDPKTGFSLEVYGQTSQGFAQSANFSLPAAASNILFGEFGGSGDDAAFLSGGDVMVLHASSMQLEQISLPVSASAMALGNFIYDRNPHIQIALLTSDGSVHIAAHSEFDPHRLSVAEMQAIRKALRNGQPNPIVPPRGAAVNGWQIVETIPAAVPFAAGHIPIFFRTRIADNGADDLMVLNGSVGQMEVISHPDSAPGAPSFQPAQISTRPYTGSPVAALAIRTNIDGRPGVVALHAGELAPMVMMPLPDPTFFVNRNDDPTPTSPITNACNNVNNTDLSSSCSVREAVLRANATTGADTIIVPAGTFTLTRGRAAAPAYDAQTGTLNINDTVTITGAGQNSTIITWGAPVGGPVDMVMAVNEDITILSNATASISNLTIENGTNNGTHGNDGDGGCMEFDTGTSGTANLTLTNVTLQGCSTTHGNGGGIAVFNFLVNGPGLATFNNSIIQNNSAVDNTSGIAATGGGIWVSDPARISMLNSQVLNNNATQVNGSVAGEGGGITITNRTTTGSRQSVIQNSIISGNHATGNGGGIHDESNLSVTQTSITNNVAGTANLTNAQDGGGLFLNPPDNGCPTGCTDSVSLQKVTITGNSATLRGGGIAAGNDTGAGPLTMNFSRLAGNTAPTGNNFSNDSTTASVTDNWWGTNSPSGTISTINTGSTTFDPFIELTHTASPATIRINQSSTLTGSIAQDNHGTAIPTSNLTELIGLPITFNNAVLGTIPNAQPETIGASGTATATFNAGGISGQGHADATVDQATVTANIVILEPLRVVKSFNPTSVAVNATSTLTFAVTNPNVIAVDANFTDTFPAGLVVAATPGVTNTCGGTVTAVAGSGSVSFSNASLPVGSCSITVKVSSAVDGVYNNSVTINSTAAGTGAQSTSSNTLTVINPPSIAKTFGAKTIPLNGTTSLTFTVSSTNQNLTLNGVGFTDGLPAGLVVASTPNLNNTCGGTATAAAGSSSVSLIGATLAPGASCTVSVSVQGTTAGVKNNSVQASSTNGGAGNTSNATITVVGPPTISKAFGAASIPLNGSTSLSFTLTNPNTTVALTGVGFSDTLPAGLVISTPNSPTGSCGGGTITATAGTNVISLTGATLAASASCTFSVNVTGITAGTQNNTTGNVTSVEGGTGGTASASINVVVPPSIAKVFNPSTIGLNATTSLTFTITNPAANAVSLTGVAFTDTLSTGLTVASGTATVCGGTLTTTAPTGIALSGATIAANSQCQFSVTVTGAASGQYTNTTGNVTSTNGGTGNTASANLTVASPPSITKVFGAATIPLNGTASLTFTIQNPNTGLTLNGLAFTDNLPAGLVVAPTPSLSNTCGGTATGAAGATSVTLSGGTLAGSASCTVAVSVQGVTAGVKNNSVSITSTEAGAGNTSNASITVVGAPGITKAFGAASIPLNGSTSLSFTINNPNTTVALTGVGFSDTLPAGLVISTPNALTGSCGGGTITATAGTNVISLSGASLAANASCTFAVNVTGITAGAQNNTTGNVTSVEGGTGGTASASINVVAPPSIAKAFNPSTINVNATTSLTFTITNPTANAVALTGVAFTDTLPTGLTAPTAPPATVCGGTLTTTAPTGIALSGATIAANSQCQFSVTVTGAASGQYTNTTGNVTSTNGGTGNTASANLTVATPPTIHKAFSPVNILLNGTTSLTFSINNPNTGLALTGVAFADTLPGGLVVATPNGLTSTCGGTVTAAAGSGSVILAGGTLAANGSCDISVNVKGIAAGVQNNTTGPISATETGPGVPSNTATVTVVSAPGITKAFGAASIPLNGSTSLSFKINNPNTTVALTGVGFSDTLPAGLVISTPNALTGSCGGGTITSTAGTNVISLTGASLAANASCTFAVNVTGITAGTQNNTTGNVTSVEGGTGGTASTSINVVAPPSIAKVFNPSTINVNATTSLTFTITNPSANAAALTGVAFTDTLPTGLTVPTAPPATVCGGTLTTTAPTGIALSGATIAANSQCQFSVTVTGAAAGSFTNTTGNVTSTNGGTGNTGSANLTVKLLLPVFSKAFGAASIPLGGSTSLSFTIQNQNPSALTGLAFSDTLPAGLVVATPNGLTGSCGAGSISATAGTNVISLSGGTLAANASCTIAVNVKGIAAGTQNNTTGNVTSTETGPGATASATINVVAPPSIAKVFNPSAITLNATTSLSFTITNPAANAVSLTGVAFSDVLPTGLTVASGTSTVCGGTLTTTAPTLISLSGATIAANSQCQFSVTVTGAASGQYTNTTGNVTSTNGGTGNTASANLTVATPPTISKSFGAPTILLNGTTSLSFAIANPNTGLALTSVAFTDSLPAGLVVATPNGLTSTCGGTVTAAAGSGSVTLAGGTPAANGSCAISLNVKGVAAGVQNNTTGPISATESGPGAPSNTATITVIAPPSIAKAFGAAAINLNATTTLSFTITNPNPTVLMTGVAFSDTLPAGLAVTSPNGLTGSCGAGTITTSASSVSLSGGTIAAGGSCTFSINVVGKTAGHKVNTTGTVTSTNAGSGNQAAATIDVNAPDLAITKTHVGKFTRGQTGAQYTIAVSNVGFGPTVGAVTVVDTPPNIVHTIVPTAISGTGWTCTLATLTCTRSDALASGSSYPPITLTVNIPINIKNVFTNTATVSGGGDVNPNDNTATDTVNLGPPIIMTPHSTEVTVSPNGTAQMAISVDVLDPTLGTIFFSCSGSSGGPLCHSNPVLLDAATAPSPTPMTISILTIKSRAALSSASRPGPARRAPLYAMLSFPAFGIVLAGFGAQNKKKAIRWLVLAVLGLALVLGMVGCGGIPHQPPPVHGTPAGTYVITVTATASGSTATATFNVVVQ
ncbi:MAG TPA: hypothetical protein VFP59_00940 [Candidatus Angelobacter sp.]|nr:hypothetical protein [Candidatus Angelobacter sp.]